MLSIQKLLKVMLYDLVIDTLLVKLICRSLCVQGGLFSHYYMFKTIKHSTILQFPIPKVLNSAFNARRMGEFSFGVSQQNKCLSSLHMGIVQQIK